MYLPDLMSEVQRAIRGMSIEQSLKYIRDQRISLRREAMKSLREFNENNFTEFLDVSRAPAKVKIEPDRTSDYADYELADAYAFLDGLEALLTPNPKESHTLPENLCETP